ncbi:MAG: iron-sulfur cluster assembly protein [Rhodospirillales bacterium]|nr:iron-sulfur cluster assembly protein [Rhodospirillales bacterium]
MDGAEPESEAPTSFEGSDEPVARAGTPAQDGGASPPSMEYLVEAMQTVFDPEIPVNIYDLGLIYGVEPDAKGDVKINMTLTSPGCPVAGILPQQLADAVAGVEGTGQITVYLVWDPPWDTDKMTEDARLTLGMF